MQADPGALLSARNVSKLYPVAPKGLGRGKSWLHAVDDVSLDIHPGETYALVGESGSGKTTLVQILLRLVPATSGTVIFDGQDVLAADTRTISQFRRRVQIVFQDPYSSLNPRMTVGQIVTEGLHDLQADSAERRRKLQELLDMVGLGSQFADRYSHQMSGGQRQRVAIARALAVDPEFLVLDEPVSALDVSIQSQILNLLRELQKALHLTYLFVSHDLAVVRHLAHRVGVMYLGKLVEEAAADELFRNPLHPYTQALLSAVPSVETPGRGRRKRIVLQGELPSAINPPAHCRFATRCFRAIEGCRSAVPALEPSASTSNHTVACFNSAPIGQEPWTV